VQATLVYEGTPEVEELEKVTTNEPLDVLVPDAAVTVAGGLVCCVEAYEVETGDVEAR
jgi:hypothetical protein